MGTLNELAVQERPDYPRDAEILDSQIFVDGFVLFIAARTHRAVKIGWV